MSKDAGLSSFQGQRILITGATGQVGFPVAVALARNNHVIALTRLRRAEDARRFEQAGVEYVTGDLEEGKLEQVPDDCDWVLHFAVARGSERDFDRDLRMNAEGTGLLMSRCRKAKGFLFCSSAAVYQPAPRPLRETDPLGDNHRAILPTYSLCKIAAESVARFAAREWKLPTVIARLSVPYGDNGGWPAYHLEQILAGQPVAVPVDGPAVYNPIHEDDCIAQIPGLLAVASVPAVTINWGGSIPVSIEEWCRHLGRLVGKEPAFHRTERTVPGLELDLTRMHERIGRTRIDWREGMRRMVAARHPEELRQ